MTNSITVQNIKCGGCANSIQKKLSNITGVSNIEIDIEEGKISWTDATSDHVEEVKNTLAKIKIGTNKLSTAMLGITFGDIYGSK